MSNFKKVGAVIVTLSLVTSLSLFSFPNKTYAIGAEAVLEIGQNLFTNIITTVEQTASTVLENSEHVRNFVLNPAAWIGGNAVIQTMAKSVLDWAVNGFNGSPAFVTDLRGHLLNVGDIEAENFFQRLLSDNSASSPFFETIVSNVRRNYYQGTSDDVSLENTFTLRDIPGYQDDFNQNFANGGLNAFLSRALNSANNPYGSYLSVQGQAARHISEARQEESRLLDFGNGFLSQRQGCGGGNTNALGGTNPSSTGSASTQTSASSGATGSTGTTGTASTGNNGTVSLSIQGLCLGRITLPGASIADQVNRALGLSGDRAVQADSMNELLGSLFQSLVGKILNGSGLLGANQPSANSVRSTLDLATDPAANVSSSTQAVATSFLNVVSGQTGEVQSFKANWVKILTAAQSAKSSGQFCGSSTRVDEVIAMATAGISKADAALAELNRIKQLATPTSSSTQADSLQASTDYQVLVSSGTLPSAEDIVYARTQSQDSQTPTFVTLYSEMTQASQNGCAPSGV